MKYLLSLSCALLLIGCSESTDTTASATPAEPAVTATNAPETVPASPTATEEAAAPTTTPVNTSTQAPAAVPAVSETPSGDAASLFGQKCVSCHGTKGEKAALGKSQIISGMNEQQIKDALKGYQTGTYGKEMKAVMQGQAKGLNDAQIDALSKYIPTL